jgi:hypothetical protein
VSVVEEFLRDRDIAFTRSGDGAWALSLAGEHKHTIPVGLALSDDGLRAESFFMRAPQENAEEVYRLLLARNARGRRAFFAIDALGDIYLVGFCPKAAVTADELDHVLGEILTTADTMFSAVIERGFATYLANDMAWRAKQSNA